MTEKTSSGQHGSRAMVLKRCCIMESPRKLKRKILALSSVLRDSGLGGKKNGLGMDISEGSAG